MSNRTCQYCNKVFQYPSILKRHLRLKNMCNKQNNFLETNLTSQKTDRVSQTTDRVSPKTDRVSPTTDRVSPTTDRVSLINKEKID